MACDSVLAVKHFWPSSSSSASLRPAPGSDDRDVAALPSQESVVQPRPLSQNKLFICFFKRRRSRGSLFLVYFYLQQWPPLCFVWLASFHQSHNLQVAVKRDHALRALLAVALTLAGKVYRPDLHFRRRRKRVYHIAAARGSQAFYLVTKTHT